MKNVLILATLFASTTTHPFFWCWRPRPPSPKVAPETPPKSPSLSPITDVKQFNSAKQALKQSNVAAAFAHFNDLTPEHKRQLLATLFTYFQTPETSGVGVSELLLIARAHHADKTIELTENWRKYLQRKTMGDL